MESHENRCFLAPNPGGDLGNLVRATGATGAGGDDFGFACPVAL